MNRLVEGYGYLGILKTFSLGMVYAKFGGFLSPFVRICDCFIGLKCAPLSALLDASSDESYSSSLIGFGDGV